MITSQSHQPTIAPVDQPAIRQLSDSRKFKLALAVDDEQLQRELFASLKSERYDLSSIVAQGLDRLAQQDLVLVSSRLPASLSLPIAFHCRTHACSTAVLALIYDFADADELIACGADDVMKVPMDTTELHARIRLLLSRQRRESVVIAAGPILLDRQKLTGQIRGAAVDLSLLEFTLLEYLLCNQNRVLTPEEIIDGVWATANTSFSSLRTCIKTLRQKIDQPGCPSLIENVYGLGYRLRLTA